MTRKRRLLLILTILLLLGAVSWFYLSRTKGPDVLSAVGLVEGQEINISSKIFGRIIKLPFQEGDLIEEGSLVVELEAKELVAQLQEAKEELKRSKAAFFRLKREKEAAKAQLAQARERLQQTEINRDQARKDYLRAKNLWEEKVISEEAYDQAHTAYLSLEAAVRAGLAEVETAARRLEVINGQIEEAKAHIAARQAAVRVLATKLEDTRIFAPCTGIVAKKYFEVGEIVSPGVPIITMWNLDHIWAKVYLDEKLVPLVYLGMPVKAWLEFGPRQYFTGRVVAIGPVGEFSTQRDVKRGRQDIRAFRIKVELEDPRGILKPGMSIQVEFRQDEQYH